MTLYSMARDLDSRRTFTDEVIIDAELGLDTKFSFDYGTNGGVSIALTSPGGTTYYLGSSECSDDVNFLIITCKFPGLAEVYETLHHWIVMCYMNIGPFQIKLIIITQQYPLLLTRFNFNPSMDK